MVRIGDGEVLQVHQCPQRLRHDVRVDRLRLAVHGAGKREALHAPSEIWPCEHRAAEEQEPLLGNRDVFVELRFDVDAERARDERERIVKVVRVEELEYGAIEFGGDGRRVRWVRLGGP